jgi:hypothetical protein
MGLSPLSLARANSLPDHFSCSPYPALTEIRGQRRQIPFFHWESQAARRSAPASTMISRICRRRAKAAGSLDTVRHSRQMAHCAACGGRTCVCACAGHKAPGSPPASMVRAEPVTRAAVAERRPHARLRSRGAPRGSLAVTLTSSLPTRTGATSHPSLLRSLFAHRGSIEGAGRVTSRGTTFCSAKSARPAPHFRNENLHADG